MELQTISQVSKSFNISTRTLRYYEQIGLIRSTKKDDYAYRTYDSETVLRLQQIVVLRKLRIPLKQIITILESENTAEIISAFRQNLNEVDEEITALSTIRTILNTFIQRLSESVHLDIKLNLFDDVSILNVVDSLTMTKINFKEERNMEDLTKASNRLRKLADRDVRIIYLPPMTVASIHTMGKLAEMDGDIPIRKLIEDNNLMKVKPDFRHFGFDHPLGKLPDGSDHGFERWITIPDGMEVQAPFVKKTFPGGLYGAHMIPMGAFDEWELLSEWVMNNDRYTYDAREPRCNNGLLEEHLNWVNHYKNPANDSSIQLDLLMPIKEKRVI